MYLNLDLLYNVNKYEFTLFYYKDIGNRYRIYSPKTKKSISIYYSNTLYYSDHITGISISSNNRYYSNNSSNEWKHFDEQTLNSIGFKKCSVKTIKKQDLDFLKSNIRIKLK